MTTAQRYEPDVDLSTLSDHPDNPRRGDTGAVTASIDANGWYGAIVAQTSTRRILAGHTRRRALTHAGTTHAPVLWIDVDDDTATRILLADNRTAELAEWDDRALAELLDQLGTADDDIQSIIGTGFTAYDLEEILCRFERPQPELTDEQSLTHEYTCPACGHTWQAP